MFRAKFWWSLLLAIPIILTSESVATWLGYSIDVAGTRFVAPVLGTVLFLYGGLPFLKSARHELAQRQPGMMTLISTAITVAFLASLATTFGWLDLDFWWELAALIVVMLLGHWQEMKAVGQAQGALQSLAALLPDTAEIIVDGEVHSVGVDRLHVGDEILVRPGERVAADGRIISGEAELDESTITGESNPVRRSTGDLVTAGTVSTDSAIRVEVRAVGSDTALAGIQRLVAEAQASSSRSQLLADRVAAWLFYLATGVALLTFGAWWIIAGPGEAVSRSVTVLVIACPHALGLAIPLVVSISTTLAARHGILVKDRMALERMRTVDAVLFDKTGTLTEGRHAVRAMEPTGEHAVADLVGIAAAVEQDSEHPLARALVEYGTEHGNPTSATEFRSLPGRGVSAQVEGHRFAVGGPALLTELEVNSPPEVADTVDRWESEGNAVLYLVSLEQPLEVWAVFALADRVRPEAREAITELRSSGVEKIVMVTGDSPAVAHSVARELGFRPGQDEVFAGILPEGKGEIVARLRDRGLSVAMVGDGVNDAPALAGADVGLAIGAGTDVAIASAGIVLASSDPRTVSAAKRLSRATYRKMEQNLIWATAYNVIAIPLAAGVLAPVGVVLSPAVGAVLMSLSTIVVAANAQLLRGFRF